APRIRSLIKGAHMHDVGKIAVRDDILLKPGPLDAAETAEMRRHVHYGLEIIASSGWLADAREIVAGHHEKFDGKGYPNGLSGEAIPLLPRVFAVADVFDALTSRRPYKAALPVAEVVPMLEAERGRHFDPAVLDAFFAVLAERGEVLPRLTGSLAEQAVEKSIARYFAIPVRPAAQRAGGAALYGRHLPSVG
ncbi:MAG: HD-GYP domain-containing protein, partial [Rhodospirillaceae bacterium]